jgi:uncharacterized protein YbjT (DUF2867 family)
MRRVLLIGATGNVGRHVLSQMPAGEVRIRVMARKPDTAPFPPHVEVIRGDLAAPETLDECLANVDAVFLVWVAPSSTIAACMDRIAKHARRVVFLSSPLKTPHPFFQQPNPMREVVAEIERAIESSGIEWTFLRPGIFAGNALRWWAAPLRAGDVVRWPCLDAPTAPIDERDIAAVAVRALCEDRHAGAEYVLTGPQSLTQFEQIATIGRALGRSLRIEEMPREEAYRVLQPPGVAKMLLDAWTASLGRPAFVTSTVEEITGRPARTLFEWASDNAAAFRAS